MSGRYNRPICRVCTTTSAITTYDHELFYPLSMNMQVCKSRKTGDTSTSATKVGKGYMPSSPNLIQDQPVLKI